MELRWLLAGLGSCAGLLFVVWELMRVNRAGLGVGGVLVVLALLGAGQGLLERIDRRTSQMERGWQAEDAVEVALEKLDDGCHVVHDIVLPGGRGNIDHVVVTGRGIYAIETKSHRGAVTFDGSRLLLNGHPFEKDVLAQTYAEAMALRDYLATVSGGEKHYVLPVLVFTRAFVKVRGGAKGVRVLPLRWLVGQLSGAGERTPEEKRAAIARSLEPLTAEAMDAV